MSKANAYKPECPPGQSQRLCVQLPEDPRPLQVVRTLDPGQHNEQQDRERILEKVRGLIADQQARVARHARKADKQAFRRGDRVLCADRRWAEAIARLDDLIEIERHLEASGSSDGRQ